MGVLPVVEVRPQPSGRREGAGQPSVRPAGQRWRRASLVASALVQRRRGDGGEARRVKTVPGAPPQALSDQQVVLGVEPPQHLTRVGDDPPRPTVRTAVSYTHLTLPTNREV